MSTLGTLAVSIVGDPRNLEKTFDGVNKQIDNFSKKMQDTGKKIGKVGKDLSLKVTAPIVAIGAIAAKTGMEFDAAMSEVAAISGATGEDLKALEDMAKEMGRTTKFSASEAAEGLKYMAMAGWDTQQQLDGLPGILNLAAASGEDLGTVSDIVTDAMTAFGMEAAQAGEFADVLAAAASNSNTNVSMLGESFKYVAPVAGALGFEAKDAATALGLMANAGIKGSQAGTALRTLLTNLVKPTKESATAMDELGISLTDADGNMKELSDVMGDLRGAFRDLGPDQQAFYAAQIAGQQGMSGLLAIVNAAEDDFNDLSGAINNSTGEAERMAAEMQDNLAGRLTELKSALEGLALQIYDVMLPALEGFVAIVQRVVDWFAQLSPGMQRAIVVVGALAAAIGPVLVVIGNIITAIGVIAPIVAKIIAAIKVVGAVIGGVAAGPIALIVAAIAALIAIIVLAIKYWDEIVAAFKAAWEWLKNVFQKWWEGFTEFWGNLWENVKNALLAAWEWIKDMFLNYTPHGLIIQHWDTIKEYFSELWDHVKGIFSDALEEIATAIRVQFLLIKLKIKGIWDDVVGVFNTVKERILSIWAGIVGGIKSVINKIISAINGMISGLNKVKFSVPSWVPALGGKSFGFNIPTIPYLAAGGDILRAGAAIVGERGPELLHLPQGAKVEPLSGGAREMRHSGTITVRGVSDQGQLVGVVDAVIERLIAEVRA